MSEDSKIQQVDPIGFQDRSVLLGVCGSVAAFKAVELCRLLVKAGAEVTVVMTESATKFVTPLSFEALSGRPVWTKMFDAPGDDPMLHITLARSAELVIVAPATADVLARAASGRADDLLSCVLLTTQAPVVVAPAMNPVMWANPVTRANVARLQELCDYQFVGPDSGEAACGETGAGRLVAPEAIAEAALHTFRSDMAGMEVLVTAGPTREAIDPVRYVSNRSSGKMGYAIAAGAARRAARVTLVSGPVALPPPYGVEHVPVTTAEEMHREVTARASASDVLIMSAAVADYRAAQPSDQKIKRSGDALTIQLLPNPDILASVAEARVKGEKPLIVGFALETDKLMQSAGEKLTRKGCDLLVANLADESIGLDASVAYILDATGVIDEPGKLPKPELADRILDRVLERVDS